MQDLASHVHDPCKEDTQADKWNEREDQYGDGYRISMGVGTQKQVSAQMLSFPLTFFPGVPLISAS
jgi:hypothetical protein